MYRDIQCIGKVHKWQYMRVIGLESGYRLIKLNFANFYFSI